MAQICYSQVISLSKGVFSKVHPDSADLFDVNANLRKVCDLLRDPNVRRNEIEIGLFEPFKPMLADRCTIGEFHRSMTGRDFYVETKYDGERMQLHMKDGRFKFYSRNGFDFTEDFGSSADSSGMFSFYAASALKKAKVGSVILDGEICAYNFVTDTLTQKGEQMNIRGLGRDHATHQQCLYVYDILLLNGRVLTNKSLEERIDILKQTVTVGWWRAIH